MLGARIAALRKARGWSQSELAGFLQVSPSAVGMYEQGRREPASEVLVKLAQVFEVTVDYLLTGQVSITQKEKVQSAMQTVLTEAEARLSQRKERPLSRQELAVLFAAMLMDS